MFIILFRYFLFDSLNIHFTQTTNYAMKYATGLSNEHIGPAFWKLFSVVCLCSFPFGVHFFVVFVSRLRLFCCAVNGTDWIWQFVVFFLVYSFSVIFIWILFSVFFVTFLIAIDCKDWKQNEEEEEKQKYEREVMQYTAFIFFFFFFQTQWMSIDVDEMFQVLVLFPCAVR